MTIPQITDLPTSPSRRTRPETYAAEADTFFDAFRNTTVDELQAMITAANTDIAAAATSKDDAETAADEAEAAADIAVSAAGAYVWSDGGSSRDFSEGESMIFTDGHVYGCIDDDQEAGESPTTHPAYWQQRTAAPVKVLRSARTSNTIIDIGDKGYSIDITSGTFTQTFESCADLGDGWYCFIHNSGTGAITIDPDGSETIDGVSSLVMYPGEIRLVYTDASNLFSKVLHGFSVTFDSTGTFYKPPGYVRFQGPAWSGGSSGQRTGSATDGRGGGGGGCGFFDLPVSAFGASETVTIGAGGEAVTTTGQNEGEATSIGSLFTVYPSPSATPYKGGSVIEDLTSATPEGYAGSEGGGALWGGGFGGTGVNGTGSIYGGGAGGGGDAASTTGGASLHGGDGGDGSDSGNGQDGEQPGGGGGGTRTGTQSGAGGAGRVIIMGVV